MNDRLRSEIPKIDGAHLTIGLGVLYLFGFIVANVHFGKYELPRIELLRARYLAAALLFILCSAIPFAVGAFLSRASHTRAPGDGPRERGLTLGQSEAWAMGPRAFFGWLLLAFLLYNVVLSQLTLSRLTALTLGLVYFIMVAMAAWQLCDQLLGGEASENAELWPSIRMSHRVLFLAFWVIFVPAAFSGFLYGSIKPALGGGALWKGRVTWRSTADSSARANGSGVVAIVSSDEHTLNMIACARAGRPTLLSVPVADVSSIQLGELVSPMSFVSDYARHCRSVDLAQKVPVLSSRRMLALALGSFVIAGLLLYWLVASERKRRQSL